jgi:hypothetical protein
MDTPVNPTPRFVSFEFVCNPKVLFRASTFLPFGKNFHSTLLLLFTLSQTRKNLQARIWAVKSPDEFNF